MKKIKTKYIYSSLIIINIGIASCFSILTLNKQNKNVIDINKNINIENNNNNIPVAPVITKDNTKETKKDNKPIKKSFSFKNCDSWDWSSWGYSKYKSCFK